MKEICPSCGTLEYKIKDYKTKKINHPILNDENCIIVYRQRRYICDTCRKTFYEKNPFFQSSKSYSSYTRVRVLKELKTPKILWIDEFYDPSTGVGKYNCILINL